MFYHREMKIQGFQIPVGAVSGHFFGFHGEAETAWSTFSKDQHPLSGGGLFIVREGAFSLSGRGVVSSKKGKTSDL